MIRAFEVHGSEYDMGVQTGSVFREFLQGSARKYEQMLSDSAVRRTVEAVTVKLESQYPRLLMEMHDS